MEISISSLTNVLSPHLFYLDIIHFTEKHQFDLLSPFPPDAGHAPSPPPATATPPQRHRHKQTIHLWQFLRDLLHREPPACHDGCIRWLDQAAGVFKIEDSKRVAQLWGQKKNRPAMNYDKLSRSVRQYYKKGIIKKTTQSKRLVYQFCPGYL